MWYVLAQLSKLIVALWTKHSGYSLLRGSAFRHFSENAAKWFTHFAELFSFPCLFLHCCLPLSWPSQTIVPCSQRSPGCGFPGGHRVSLKAALLSLWGSFFTSRALPPFPVNTRQLCWGVPIIVPIAHPGPPLVSCYTNAWQWVLQSNLFCICIWGFPSMPCCVIWF